MNGCLVGFHLERDIVLEEDESSLEIRYRHAGVRIPDIHAHEIARFRIETINGRPSAA